MTHNQIIAIAISMARQAFDQRDAYDDARQSYRESLIDTMCEEECDDEYTYNAALCAFDVEADKVFA